MDKEQQREPGLTSVLQRMNADAPTDRPAAAAAALELCRALMFGGSPMAIATGLAAEKVGWGRAPDEDAAFGFVVRDLFEDLEEVTIAVSEIAYAIAGRDDVTQTGREDRELKFALSQGLRCAAERLDSGDDLAECLDMIGEDLAGFLSSDGPALDRAATCLEHIALTMRTHRPDGAGGQA